ncbi:unnamed protein product (macronuclear) [Paramecium tetraurelia]|uniref:Transmembrane protein n=1 Tax=Paramecium tetraurelia TaxID=5888 RepID=A0BS87_PARTE|nr:uncharacterized protein GSPATT00031635001 [Paramecium tetraurelia]CAK61404.1 unnamed protein product [Paramecium tetraurelia]|eukprot:XP_001428802.1 hypothetical protein (macronuclear) [Paramecium tetraurelia strain d4-2]
MNLKLYFLLNHKEQKCTSTFLWKLKLINLFIKVLPKYLLHVFQKQHFLIQKRLSDQDIFLISFQVFQKENLSKNKVLLQVSYVKIQIKMMLYFFKAGFNLSKSWSSDYFNCQLFHEQYINPLLLIIQNYKKLEGQPQDRFNTLILSSKAINYSIIYCYNQSFVQQRQFILSKCHTGKA